METPERTIEFTWTRAEALGLYRTLYRRSILTIAVLGVAITAGLVSAGNTVAAVTCAAVVAVLLLQFALIPRRLWRQEHPGTSGAHRYTWDDDRIRLDAASFSVEHRAGSVTRVETPSGFVIVRCRAPALLGIPERGFTDAAQKDDFLSVAHSLATSERSMVAATMDRRNRRLNMAVCLGLVAVVAALTIYRSTSGEDDPATDPAFDEASDRWAESGPESYELSYVIRMAEGLSEQCRVLVVGDEITSAVPLDGGECPNTEQGPSTMEGLLDYVRAGLAAEPEAVTLEFDADDGHLIYFEVAETADRGEWSITVTELRPVNEDDS